MIMRCAKSWKFYIEEHFSEIVPQLLATTVHSLVQRSSQSSTHILSNFFLGKQTINSWIVPPCNQSSDVLDSNTSPCLFPPFRVSEVTLLFVCQGDPCRISDRWIIHNPECMMLLLALNPLYWMSHVVFPRSRVKRLHLFHISLNTSTEKKWQVVLLLLQPPATLSPTHITLISPSPPPSLSVGLLWNVADESNLPEGRFVHITAF